MSRSLFKIIVFLRSDPSLLSKEKYFKSVFLSELET